MESRRRAFNYKQQAWSWLKQAYCMKFAANLLLERIRNRGDEIALRISAGDSFMAMTTELTAEGALRGPYMFLAGMALENLIKGIRILTQPDLMNPVTGTLNKELGTHDLVKLIEQMELSFCRVDFSVPELEFLTKLSKNIVWAGKYPVARRYQEQEQLEFNREVDPQLFEQLFERIKSIVDDMMREHGGAHVVFPRDLDSD